MSAQYTYRALQPSSEIFRLLVIEPGQPNEDLVCSLIHAESVNIPDYEALSYTWASEGPLQNIKVHGISPFPSNNESADDIESFLPITSNLHSALLRFRLPDTPRIIWADAICINQNDIAERGQQVSIMKDIYSNATQVLVWLGDGFESDRMVFDLIERFTVDFDIDSDVDGYTITDPLGIPDVFRYDTKCVALGNSLRDLEDEGNTARWDAIRLFFAKPWFTRIWIIQEVVMAKHAQIFCGDSETCSFDVLCQMVIWILGCGFGVLLRGIAHSSLSMITILRRERKAGAESPALIMTSNLFRASGCTDHRDRIFALLGVTSWSLGIIPDYTLSWQKLYTHLATRALVDQNMCFTMLSSAGCPTEEEHSGLPSWVPDWSNNRKYPVSLHYAPWLNFKAAKDTDIMIWYGHREHTIEVEGFEFDTIELVSSQGLDQQAEPKDSMAPVDRSFVLSKDFRLRDIFQDWDQIVKQSDSILHYQDIDDAVSRLYLCGRSIADPQNVLPPEDLLKGAYRELRRRLNNVENIDTYFKTYPDRVKYHAVVIGYNNTMLVCLPWRRLCMTKKGYLVLAPVTVQEGDIVCIISGSNVPYILRRCDDGTYLIVGECYVQGIMFGEAFSEGDLERQTFTIK